MRTKTKLNCREGNSQCGGKCQPESYKCPSEKSVEASVVSDKFMSLVTKTQVQPKNLDTLFEDYESLISAESKKLSRAKIKGLPNEKELKKELLSAEAKAWVFVRLMREKNRLSKKGEEVGELEALLQKIAGGDSLAISKALTDLDAKIAEKRMAKVEAKISAPIAEAIEVFVKEKETMVEAELVDSELYKERFDKIREKLDAVGFSLIDENTINLGNAKDKLKEIAQLASEKIKQHLYATEEISDEEYYGVRATKPIYNILAQIDFENYTEEDARELLKFANEYILSSAAPRGAFSKTEIKQIKRRLSYKRYGDTTKKKAAAGNTGLRGKASVPPIPAKFLESEAEPVDESFRNWLEEARVVVQVTPKALIAIASDGKFKNMFEGKAIDSIAKGRAGYKKHRKETEDKKFGLEGGAARHRPIYGYVESPYYLMSAAENNSVEFYGEISVVLKNEINKRATITLDDSLDERYAMPTPMLSPKKECLIAPMRDVAHEGGSRADLKAVGSPAETLTGYIEAQIFGGISLDDIDFVILPSFLPEDLIEELMSILMSKGINFRLGK